MFSKQISRMFWEILRRFYWIFISNFPISIQFFLIFILTEDKCDSINLVERKTQEGENNLYGY